MKNLISYRQTATLTMIFLAAASIALSVDSSETSAGKIVQKVAFVLISQEDIDALMDTPASPTASVRRAEQSHPEGPEIIVRKPEGAEIESPLSLDIQFKPKGSATIAMDTLSVKYKRGFLSLDVTNRLLKNAEVSADGIIAEMATVPAGKHLFTVALEDSLGRRSVSSLEFVCVDG